MQPSTITAQATAIIESFSAQYMQVVYSNQALEFVLGGNEGGKWRVVTSSKAIKKPDTLLDEWSLCRKEFGL